MCNISAIKLQGCQFLGQQLHLPSLCTRKEHTTHLLLALFYCCCIIRKIIAAMYINVTIVYCHICIKYAFLSYLYQICFFSPSLIVPDTQSLQKVLIITQQHRWFCERHKRNYLFSRFLLRLQFLSSQCFTSMIHVHFFFPKCTLVLVKICLKNIFMLDLLRCKKCAAVIRYHSLHESKVYLNGFTCE